ncbi:hypothetical protein ILUMI_24866 [Ignelater luminosus]|uniref:Multidrug resistance-associated protein lethal(2)03659 n=1 Tax=Ignelater luminosus TaxID=2038154 RepID=A0A8K0FWF7_IGNLU|nr:hypothetical protein ILUMI_24866 [Ignelater luminosus]
MDSSKEQDRKVNPSETANVFSKILFAFTCPTFRKGWNKDLDEDDIYKVVQSCSSTPLGNRLEKEWDKQKRKRNSTIAVPIMRMFGLQFFILGMALLFINTSFIVAKPLMIGRIVSYFSSNPDITRETAVYYTLALIACIFANITFLHNYMFAIQSLSFKMKIACCTLIYRKLLRLSSLAVSKTVSGKAVTLMTKDVLSFDLAIHFAHQMWIGTIQTIIVTFVMYKQIGVSALTGISILIFLIPVQVYLGHKTSIYRLKTAARTDQRVRITQEILTAMRIIKMYTWELFFGKSVNKLRQKELCNLRILFYIKAFGISIGQLSSRLAFYICVMAYVALGNHITAEKAFVVTGCFAALRSVLTVFMPLGISQMAELKAALERITDFLQLEEVPESPTVNYIEEKQPKIHIENAIVKSDKGIDILENITLEIKPGLTILTGPVGAGKSTLFKLMLSDIKRDQGTVDICGKLSYASQEPWLFPGTVKQNIIFGEWFDEKRYETIIKVCALKKDFDAFPHGDKTCLTDKGLNLSRGQKARINLARAIYKVADIYLLDDCLSAVDTHVGKHIFYECIKGFLKDNICILVTHHGQFLREADNVVLLDKGVLKFQGNYAILKQENNEELSTINNYENTEEGYVEAEEIEDKIANNIDNTNETSKLLLNKVPTKKHIYEEAKEEGAVKKEVYYKYFTAGGGLKMLILLVVLSIIAQVTASWSDYFVSFWVDMEQKLSGFRYNQTTNSTEYKELEESHDSVMKQYSFVILAATIFTLLKGFAFFTFATIASRNIHNLVLEKILNATMIFFDTHLSGNILNRFSRDLGILDEQMPYTIHEVTKIILTLLATLLVVSSVNLFFLIPSAIFILILFIARRLYIPTGRSIRRLEGATRSPVIGHLSATLEGLTTIRANQAQKILKKEFDRHQDLYNSVSYMQLATTRAFGFYLDTLSSFYITVITLTFLFVKTETLAGQVGLAITQSFSLTGLLQWGVRQWAELENQMTSTERVLEYSKIESEEKSGDSLNNWPDNGKIVYTDVSLRYNSTSERVLKGIDFTILPKQKIGVVGRTGAGKTSIISTLFRMYEYRGTICIDDVDINSVTVELLRSKISIIPQDPVLFSGTVRSNLDPNNEYTDKELWDALEEVEMKKLVGSLNSSISEGGANFSIGQRQLLCLARAIIRNNIILILDEATANVDPQTDSLIQRTIKRKFFDCTVITIAHRLHTIMDSDSVLVMDSGVAAEYDHPKVLLEKKGLFYNMVKEAGLL